MKRLALFLSLDGGGGGLGRGALEPVCSFQCNDAPVSLVLTLRFAMSTDLPQSHTIRVTIVAAVRQQPAHSQADTITMFE